MLLTTTQIELFKQAIRDKRISVMGFDLETSLSQFYAWGTGEQYLSHPQLVKGTETKIITAQYKQYLLDKKSQYFVWDNGNDELIVEEIINILNNADIVIAQNGKQFDIKVLQERAKALRLPPVNIDFMIDTLTASRGSFKAMSHKLDYRSKQYGLGGKDRMEMQDWIDVGNGDKKALDKMIKYGLKDNDDTEQVFWRELPYYNLPKTTINRILKFIIQPEEAQKEKQQLKVRCPDCHKKRQLKFNTVQIQKANNIWQCLNCGLKFENKS